MYTSLVLPQSFKMIFCLFPFSVQTFVLRITNSQEYFHTNALCIHKLFCTTSIISLDTKWQVMDVFSCLSYLFHWVTYSISKYYFCSVTSMWLIFLYSPNKSIQKYSRMLSIPQKTIHSMFKPKWEGGTECGKRIIIRIN